MLININNFLLALSLFFIVVIGSISIYSVTSIDLNYFFRFLTISVFSIILVSTFFYFVNFNRIISIGWIIFLLNILLIISVEFFGKEINGSKRWLDFGFLSLQPSEFLKVSFAIFVIQYLRYFDFKFTVIRSVILLAILVASALPIIIQPDLGTGIVFVAFGLLLLFICGMKFKYFFILALSFLVLSPAIYSYGLSDYQKGRILNWFSSEDTLAESWNILQSKISIGSGELFGEGFLGSKQNEFNFLPESDTDFIFSIYAEQFGFLGVAIILILLGIFIFCGLSGFRQKNILADDYSAYYLGIYFLMVITFSFLINIFMVSGLIPVVGLPLPFFTKGGSSLLCFSIMLGFIFSAKTYLKT